MKTVGWRNKRHVLKHRGVAGKQRVETVLPTVSRHSSLAPGDARVDPVTGYVVPYDENLLDRARTQWQFGDWEGLAGLGEEVLRHHPERARLAALVASGKLQLGEIDGARQMFTMAREWGANTQLLAQVLISGAHNSLGRAAATLGDGERALEHFQSAVATGNPGGAVDLLLEARMTCQLAQLGLGAPAASPILTPAIRGRLKYMGSRIGAEDTD